MDDTQKLQLIQQVATDVVESHTSCKLGKPSKADKAIKALEIVLVATGYRDKDVVINAAI